MKEKHVLEGFYHDTLGERDRHLALAKVRDFVLRLFAEAPLRVDLRDADTRGATYEEARTLAAPLPAYSPKAWFWQAYRANLRLGGRLSDGVRLGHETGFDSGSTLDYVYRNQAAGRGWLGRMADRHYLDAIGWRGIRQRKLHVEELLLAALARLGCDGRPLRVLDIAAGHGRYVLDALGRAGQRPEAIVLRAGLFAQCLRGGGVAAVSRLGRRCRGGAAVARAGSARGGVTAGVAGATHS